MYIALYIIIFIGTAGSGKSHLTASFGEWLKLKKQNVNFVNLDPGVISLPYNPDIDARNYVNIFELMEEFKLGPNGALLMAADLIADHAEEIKESIYDMGADIILVDTPGQIELFAFRESGPYITGAIAECPKATVFLFDAPFCKNPLNYVSNVYLSIAAYTRLIQPQVCALSKVDLISKPELENILLWQEDLDNLSESLRIGGKIEQSLISEGLIRAITETGLNIQPIPISSKLSSGMDELNAELTRILSGGEEERP